METLLTSMTQEHDRYTMYDGSLSSSQWSKLWAERVPLSEHGAACLMILQMAKLLSFDCGLHKAANTPIPAGAATQPGFEKGSAAASMATSSLDLVLKLSSRSSFSPDEFRYAPDKDACTMTMCCLPSISSSHRIERLASR